MLTESETAQKWGVTFKAVNTGSVTLRVATAGQGPLIILAHGFPECWYSWRHQIRPLVAAGYQLAIPDVRGYGGSDRPQAIEEYDMQCLTADMAGLAKALSPRQPSIIIGHDWGAPIAWNSALLYPQQFRAVGGMSVPHVPPGKIETLDLYKKLFTDKGFFFYMLYFQEEGVAEAELEADTSKTIRLFYTAIAGDAQEGAWPTRKPAGQKLFDGVIEPDMPRVWLSNEDVQYYTSQFEKSGFRGPVNRYRNFSRDSAFLKSRNATVITQPSLFISGSKDMVARMYPSGPAAAMEPYVCESHTALTIADCGHWTQQEKAQEVNTILIDWLARLA